MTTNMTTQVMQQALDALERNVQHKYPLQQREAIALGQAAIAALREAIAAHDAEIAALKAAQPVEPADLPVNWAGMIHYPDCWDTAAYPALRDAIHECLAWSGCSVCKPAQPAPAAPYQVPDGWVAVADRVPPCDLTPNSFGVAVLVYPPYQSGDSSDMTQAFYGCRQTDEPNFYIFGCCFYPTHWMPIPAAPKAAA